MTGLTQARFATLLREGMDEFDISNDWLSKEGGWHPTTVAKWRRLDRTEGPPKARTRRQIEKVAGFPYLFLDGAVKANWQELQKERAKQGRQGVDKYEQDPTLPPAWLQAKQMILEQVVVFERRAAGVPPAHVLLWLADLERAVRAISAGGDAWASAKDAVELAGGATPAPPPRAAAKSPKARRGRRAG